MVALASRTVRGARPPLCPLPLPPLYLLAWRARRFDKARGFEVWYDDLMSYLDAAPFLNSRARSCGLQTMKHVAAYLLAQLGGNASPDEAVRLADLPYCELA